MTTIQVRLFAALREEADSSQVEADGSTVGEVVDALCARYGERFARIARAGSVVVDGERAARELPLRQGDEIALLPPVSGGSGPRRASRWAQRRRGGARAATSPAILLPP